MRLCISSRIYSSRLQIGADLVFITRLSSTSASFDIKELSTDGWEGDMELGHTFLAGGPGGVRCVMLIDAPESTD